MNDLVTLAQAGPVAILIVGIVAMVRGFITGAVVPGWIYRLEQEQRVKAEIQAERNAEALAALAKAAARDRDAGTPNAAA